MAHDEIQGGQMESADRPNVQTVEKYTLMVHHRNTAARAKLVYDLSSDERSGGMHSQCPSSRME
jgi:hypothetical protein